MNIITIMIGVLIISILGIILAYKFLYNDLEEIVGKISAYMFVLSLIMLLVTIPSHCYYRTTDKYYDLLKARNNDYSITEIIKWNDSCRILGVNRIIEIDEKRR